MSLLPLPIKVKFREVRVQHVQGADVLPRRHPVGPVPDLLDDAPNRDWLGRMNRPNQGQFPSFLQLADHLGVHGLFVSLSQFAGDFAIAVKRMSACDVQQRLTQRGVLHRQRRPFALTVMPGVLAQSQRRQRPVQTVGGRPPARPASFSPHGSVLGPKIFEQRDLHLLLPQKARQLTNPLFVPTHRLTIPEELSPVFKKLFLLQTQSDRMHPVCAGNLSQLLLLA